MKGWEQAAGQGFASTHSEWQRFSRPPAEHGLWEQVSSGHGASRTLPVCSGRRAPPRSHVGSLSQVLFWLRNPLISQNHFNGSASIFILGWRSESEARPTPWDLCRPVPGHGIPCSFQQVTDKAARLKRKQRQDGACSWPWSSVHSRCSAAVF